jgi:hypothetical protein
MATAPPTNSATIRPASQPLRIPPDETMWKRYSPHGEAPLSFVGSMATHFLVVGLLAIFGFLAYLFFNPPLHDLQVDTVRMPGGGGGSTKGEGSGSGLGTGGEEIGGEENKDPQTLDPDLVKRPPLTVDEAKTLNVEFKDDPAATRFIEEGNEQLKKLARLNKEMRNTLRDGVNPGAGKGGTGEGGGKGIGKGPGNGPGEGAGAPLSTREKRMLRWSMSFNRSTYLEQLRDLGAIIAVPVGRDNKRYQVCDLTQQPLRWTEDDLSNNKRIFWIDDKPDSVRALMSQMGRPGYTSHFVALLPPELEKKLFDLELKFGNLNEDDIFETKFDCIKGSDGRYDVVVKSQKPK